MLAYPEPTPHSLEDLDPAEHLLIRGLRTMAVGHGDCPAMGQMFERLCGGMGQATLQAHFILVRLLGMGARRQMRVHAPGCPCVGADETALVGLVAAAQQALRNGDDGLLRLRLGFMARQESSDVVRSAVMGLAQILSLSGRTLPIRMEDSGERPEEPVALRRVH